MAVAKHREIELKYCLTETEYRRLRRQVKGKTSRFTNTFFDTPELALKKAGIGCRIRRVSDGPAYFTVKHGGGTRKGVHSRIEIESGVSPAKAARLVRGASPLASLRGTEQISTLERLVGKKVVEALRPLGSLATSRTKFRFSGLVGELDRCRLGRSFFHELEVESQAPAAADKKARALLETLGIPARPDPTTKLARFFAHLRR